MFYQKLYSIDPVKAYYVYRSWIMLTYTLQVASAELPSTQLQWDSPEKYVNITHGDITADRAQKRIHITYKINQNTKALVILNFGDENFIVGNGILQLILIMPTCFALFYLCRDGCYSKFYILSQFWYAPRWNNRNCQVLYFSNIYSLCVWNSEGYILSWI